MSNGKLQHDFVMYVISGVEHCFKCFLKLFKTKVKLMSQTLLMNKHILTQYQTVDKIE